MISYKEFKDLLRTDCNLRTELTSRIKGNVSTSDIDILIDSCITKTETELTGEEFISSIGGTALSVGSCRVSTINLVRIAYESNCKEKKYLDILRERVLLDCKALTSMRHILQRNIEKGLLPNFQDGAVELSKQFSTIGGIGLYEVMDMFGYIDTDEFGNKSYSDDGIRFATQILDTINEVKDSFECDFTFNLEFVPAENAAGVMCKADNLLFRDGSNDWSTHWYTIEYNGVKYKLNHQSQVTVNISGKKKTCSFQDAIDNNYDIDEESLTKFKI